jgi:hypothetical protein
MTGGTLVVSRSAAALSLSKDPCEPEIT